MSNSFEGYLESVAFELYLLEKLRLAVEINSGSLDFRGEQDIRVFSLYSDISEAAVNELKDDLTPLIFGAAWKILDLLLEFSLNCAGLHPAHKVWTISEKQRHALASNGDSTILGCSKKVWEGILHAYASTVEHRHCLIHRIAEISVETGALSGVDRKGKNLIPLTRSQQIAMAEIACLACRAVISKVIDSRLENQLKYFLDCLVPHTQATAFGTGALVAPVQIRLTLDVESDQFFLNTFGVLERARGLVPHATHFDLLVDVPDGSGRHIFCKAETVPSAKVSIDLNKLPSWLELR